MNFLPKSVVSSGQSVIDAPMRKSRTPPRHGRKPHQEANKRPGQATRGDARAAPRSRSGRKGGDDSELFLYGMHTVRSALANPNRKIRKIYLTENALPRLQDSLSAEHAALVEIRQAKALDQLVGGEAVHQGAVIACAPLDTLDASELFHLADCKLVLALDQLTDPHNAGAILRSASALGVDAVLTTSRNSAHETAVLAKSASGALDTIRLIHLRNLSKGLDELNQMGFMTIGLDSEGPLILETTLAESAAEKVVLVLGSEGRGLREKTREMALCWSNAVFLNPLLEGRTPMRIILT